MMVLKYLHFELLNNFDNHYIHPRPKIFIINQKKNDLAFYRQENVDKFRNYEAKYNELTEGTTSEFLILFPIPT